MDARPTWSPPHRHATALSWGVETSPSLSAGSWGVPASLQLDNVGADTLTRDAVYRARIPLPDALRLFARIKARSLLP